MTKILFRFLLFTASLLGFKAVAGQPLSHEPKGPELYRTILHMDSVMFDAFNSHNLDVLKTVFASDAEFYHDKGGLSDYQTTMNNFTAVFAATPGLRRELVPGTLEVYPIPGYGAVEIGTHRFVHTENGQTLTGIYHFIHTWQYKDNQWRVTRAISVGH